MLKNGSDANDSYLFLIRLWPDKENGGDPEWRAKVQHVKSGQARYLQDPPALYDTILAMLDELGQTGRPPA
jgi:hypothetical protein